jgi:gamma-glutamylaminecyclotransferase
MTVRMRVFVYGSLMRNMPYAKHMAGAEFIATCRACPQYALILYREGYPALVPRGDAAEGVGVVGELYLVDEDHLARLDAFEECPELYQRRLIRLADGSRAEAYCVGEEELGRWPLIERWEPKMTRGAWQ